MAFSRGISSVVDVPSLLRVTMYGTISTPAIGVSVFNVARVTTKLLMEESLILMTIDRWILKDDFTRGGGAAAAAAAGNGGQKQPPLKAFRSLRALSLSRNVRL